MPFVLAPAASDLPACCCELVACCCCCCCCCCCGLGVLEAGLPGGAGMLAPHIWFARSGLLKSKGCSAVALRRTVNITEGRFACAWTMSITRPWTCHLILRDVSIIWRAGSPACPHAGTHTGRGGVPLVARNWPANQQEPYGRYGVDSGRCQECWPDGRDEARTAASSGQLPAGRHVAWLGQCWDCRKQGSTVGLQEAGRPACMDSRRKPWRHITAGVQKSSPKVHSCTIDSEGNCGQAGFQLCVVIIIIIFLCSSKQAASSKDVDDSEGQARWDKGITSCLPLKTEHQWDPGEDAHLQRVHKTFCQLVDRVLGILVCRRQHWQGHRGRDASSPEQCTQKHQSGHVKVCECAQRAPGGYQCKQAGKQVQRSHPLPMGASRAQGLSHSVRLIAPGLQCVTTASVRDEQVCPGGRAQGEARPCDPLVAIVRRCDPLVAIVSQPGLTCRKRRPPCA